MVAKFLWREENAEDVSCGIERDDSAMGML